MMSTNTFDREIIITSPEGIKKLEEMMNAEPEELIPLHTYGTEERKHAEELVKLWASRLKRSSET